MKPDGVTFVTTDALTVRLIAWTRTHTQLALLILIWSTIGIGMLLRGAQYLANRSLWYDELMLALNIVNKPFAQLLLPLEYGQAAPIGFLMVEKVAIQIFGNNEFALRLFPLLCGMLSVYLYYEVAQRFVRRPAVIIGLAIISISDPLIYYSSELKQYSSDVAITLGLYLIGLYYLERRQLNIANGLVLGFIGAIAIWFSQPSAFVLAAMGLALLSSHLNLNSKSARSFIADTFAVSLWITSFVLYYFIQLRYLIHNEELVDYWKNAFMPFLPTSLSDARWFLDAGFAIFRDPVGLSATGIAAFLFLMGCYSMYGQHKDKLYLLALPILFALLASALKKYPFSGRLLLFTVPSVVVLISAGIEEVRDRTVKYSYAIGIVLLGLLFLHPALAAGNHLMHPRTGEEIKPVLNYLKTKHREGDVEYVYYGADRAFKYYGSKYNLVANHIEGVRARDNWGEYARDLAKLKGNKRVWVLFSHLYDEAERKFFLYYLGTMGTKVDSFEGQGAAVYLFDLSKSILFE